MTDLRPITGSLGSQGVPSGRSTPTDPGPNKMFVGGLSWQTTAEDIEEYFGSFGIVKDVLLMKDPVTQRSRGFGFITFGDSSSVEKVMRVSSHILNGKTIDPKYATPKNKRVNNRTKKVFIGGVSQETSVEEVKTYFSLFGKVEEAVLLMDNQTKRHRGFGFLTFECENIVENVCNIQFHTIKGKKVECKKAQPKEAALAAQAASFLSKRLFVSGGSPMAPTQVAQLHAATTASAHATALSNYGKLISGGGYSPLSAYRYAPYPMLGTGGSSTTFCPPTHSLSFNSLPVNPSYNHVPSTYPTHNTLTSQATLPSPYQGYTLANVDMSSFQGVDWSPMYYVNLTPSETSYSQVPGYK